MFRVLDSPFKVAVWGQLSTAGGQQPLVRGASDVSIVVNTASGVSPDGRAFDRNRVESKFGNFSEASSEE